jgi:hypothetical protein
MARLAIAALLLLLAACSSDNGSGATAQAPNARFAPDAADVVEVRITDRLPLEAAELVAPDGSSVAARDIQRDRIVEQRQPVRAGPAFGVGVFGGSGGHFGTGAGIGFPIGGYGYESGPGETRVQSLARIEIPDMAAYRAGWPNWKVRLKLGTTEAGNRTIEIPAPRPPEG